VTGVQTCALPILLFQISNVTRPVFTEMRATPRAFLATIVAFRPLDQFESSLGLTYDVSEGGVFIRTTDAPERGTIVNLDICLSSIASQVLSLRARVVWVHQLRPGVPVKTPAGFGTEIVPDDCPRADIGIYRSACAVLTGKNAPPPLAAALSTSS
jgi:hypothetical protein